MKKLYKREKPLEKHNFISEIYNLLTNLILMWIMVKIAGSSMVQRLNFEYPFSNKAFTVFVVEFCSGLLF